MNGQPGLPAGSDTRASAGPAVQSETGHREPNLWVQANSTLAGQGGNPTSCPQTPNTPGPQLQLHHPGAAPPGAMLTSLQTDVPMGKNLSVPSTKSMGFPEGSDGKESACNAGDWSWIPGWRRSPGMAPHSSIFAWRIPWTEGPGGQQPMGSQKSWTRFSN